MGLISGIAGGNAAEAKAEAMKEIASGYGKVGRKQYDWLSPWMNAGTQALTAQMQMLANPLNSQGALNDYYSGSQYAAEEQQAQYAAESAAEATGTMGSTATGNALASQSVSLGQNYLKGLNQQRQQQMNTLGGISSQGLGASKTMGQFAFQDYNAAANLLTGAANAQYQASVSPYVGGEAGAKAGAGLFNYGKGKGWSNTASGIAGAVGFLV